MYFNENKSIFCLTRFTEISVVLLIAEVVWSRFWALFICKGHFLPEVTAKNTLLWRMQHIDDNAWPPMSWSMEAVYLEVRLMDSSWERPRLLGDKGCWSNNPSKTPPGGQQRTIHRHPFNFLQTYFNRPKNPPLLQILLSLSSSGTCFSTCSVNNRGCYLVNIHFAQYQMCKRPFVDKESYWNKWTHHGE